MGNTTAVVKRRWRGWRIVPWGLMLGMVLVVILCGPALWHWGRVYFGDRDGRVKLAAGMVDDASRLNATAVAGVVNVPEGEAAEAELRELILRARREGLKVTVAGARHSMGGHTIYPGGIAINMLPFRAMTLDKGRRILKVGAGARWAEVLPFLDKEGFSVEVMQSFNDFSVGGTLSVNAHGWAYGKGPVATTVESFRLMNSEGKILRCSRAENAELFSLVLGGYGLFGIILDAELRVVPNARYRASRVVMPVKGFLATAAMLEAGGVRPAMAFGRLSVAPSSFMEQGVLTTFYPEAGPVPALVERSTPASVRTVYRGAQGSDYGKELRWKMEKWWDEEMGRTVVSRNQLLHEAFEGYENRSADTTDILQEYFVPAKEFVGFVGDLKGIVRKHRTDLINATVRDVRNDDVTFLRYAEGDVIAIVLLLVQDRTASGEANMEAVTRDLIDAALARGGRYYLPYRLHATKEQFRAAYPMGEKFFELKRKYDAGEIFQNQFYVKYGR
jgi:FAD/FMN-containing dehydrogenase